MIERIVITKIMRAGFGSGKPVQVMLGFFDAQGTLQGSQLVSANLFDDDVREGKEVNFKQEKHLPFYIEMNKKDF